MALFPDFYQTNVVEQFAINLFYGWGYNFYRTENLLRADNLLIRERVSEILGVVKTALTEAESDYRKEYLPPLSRESPRPDPEVLATARALEALARKVGAIEGQVRALPVPETDRIHQRYRSEASTLMRLIEADKAIAGQAEILRQGLSGRTALEVFANMPEVTTLLVVLSASVQKRRDIL